MSCSPAVSCPNLTLCCYLEASKCFSSKEAQHCYKTLFACSPLRGFSYPQWLEAMVGVLDTVPYDLGARKVRVVKLQTPRLSRRFSQGSPFSSQNSIEDFQVSRLTSAATPPPGAADKRPRHQVVIPCTWNVIGQRILQLSPEQSVFVRGG